MSLNESKRLRKTPGSAWRGSAPGSLGKWVLDGVSLDTRPSPTLRTQRAEGPEIASCRPSDALP